MRRRLRIDVQSLSQEDVKEKEEHHESNSHSDNPLLQLLGEYSNDENGHDDAAPTASDSVDMKIDNFLDELEKITKESLRPTTDSKKQNSTESSTTSTLATDTAWRRCVDSQSGDIYFWNTVTGETTWDPPPLPPESLNTTLNGDELAAKRRKVIPNGVDVVDKPMNASTASDGTIPTTLTPANSSEKGELNAATTQPSTTLEQHSQVTMVKQEIESLITEIHTTICQMVLSETAHPKQAVSANASDEHTLADEVKTEARNLQQIKLEFDLRVADWRQGELRDEFMVQKLRDMHSRLMAYSCNINHSHPISSTSSSFEKPPISSPTNTEATTTSIITTDLSPYKHLYVVGWCLLQDPSGAFYYANILTGETSWELPSFVEPACSVSGNGTSTLVCAAAPVRYATAESQSNLPHPPPSSPPPPPPPPPAGPNPPHLYSQPSKPISKKVAIKNSTTVDHKMSGLFQKWQSAKTELADECDDEKQFGSENSQPKKLQIAEWRSEQIRSGEANNNPNFIPLPPGDWPRERSDKIRRLSSSNS
jgi:hypothetical protein